MKLSKTLLTIAAVVLTAGFVQAVPITGMLNIAGTATFDTKSLMTATRVNSFSNVTVQGGNSGDFAAIAIGTPVVMTALYIFAPSTYQRIMECSWIHLRAPCFQRASAA